jgi:hypothetical protein
MTYDLMNRRNNVTAHHTGVKGSLETVDQYISLGLDPKKINLGFAYYAKWFKTSETGDCEANPIGCPTDLLENPDGTDAGKSGAVTFEKGNMAPAQKNLAVSNEDQCGPSIGKRCKPGLCCSQYGSWYVISTPIILTPMIYIFSPANPPATNSGDELAAKPPNTATKPVSQGTATAPNPPSQLPG